MPPNSPAWPSRRSCSVPEPQQLRPRDPGRPVPQVGPRQCAQRRRGLSQGRWRRNRRLAVPYGRDICQIGIRRRLCDAIVSRRRLIQDEDTHGSRQEGRPRSSPAAGMSIVELDGISQLRFIQVVKTRARVTIILSRMAMVHQQKRQNGDNLKIGESLCLVCMQVGRKYSQCHKQKYPVVDF
jgi:hypothetical protein